jgi:group I intron endonuclease
MPALMDNPVLSGIYQITCLPTGKIYIGSSVDIEYRKGKHFYLLREGRHPNPHLQSAYCKYGKDSFSFEIIHDLTGLSRADILEKEQVCLDSLDWSRAFNVCKDARGGQIIPEANERRRASLKAYYSKNRDKLRGENNPFYGKKHTEKSKKAVSEANTGRVRSDEFKKQKSELMKSRKGLHHSEAYRDSLSLKYGGAGNPGAQEVTVNGVKYGCKKDAIRALGLKSYYHLDKLLKAERLSQEGVESSDSKRVPPSSEG